MNAAACATPAPRPPASRRAAGSATRRSRPGARAARARPGRRASGASGRRLRCNPTRTRLWHRRAHGSAARRQARAVLARARRARGPSALLELLRGGPARSPLCRACARGLRRLPPELVALAGVPCFSASPTRARRATLVRALKFRAALAVADSMAAAIAATAPDGLFARRGARAGPARARPRAPARLQPGARARPRARPAHRLRGRRVPRARRRAAGTQVGRDRAERTRALRRLDARLGAAPRPTRCWWTTWSPPAPPSRRAPRPSAGPAASRSRRSPTRARWGV